MLKKFLQIAEKPLRIYFFFSLFDCLVGLFGILIYGIYTHLTGPIWVRNQYIGLWLTLLIFFYSIQSILIELKLTIKTNKNYIFYLNCIYYALTSLVSFLMIIFFGLCSKIDATIWSVYIFAVSCCNIYILFLITKKQYEPSLNETTDEDRSDNENLRIDLTNLPNQSKKCKKCSAFVYVFDLVLKILSFIFICLLLNGSIVNGTGNIKYPPRGKFMKVKLDDNSGRELKVHYKCDGPINNTYPVFIFEGDGSHGLLDYLNLQILLKENNRRSCIWDKPGVGYSDYLYNDMANYSLIYNNMVKSLNENPPFIFVGWGGGAETIYEYASNYPNMVDSLTFLDSSPVNVEFKIPFILKNWTVEQLDSYKTNELNRRTSLINLINGIGVPWGLMSSFLSPYKSFFSNLVNEINWYYLTEKTWATQAYFLSKMKNQVSVFEKKDINQSIPINLIISYKSDQQIVDEICFPKKYNTNSTECLYEIEYNKIYIKERVNLMNLSKNGKLVKCTMNECDQGYFIAKGAMFTVENLLEIYK